MFLSFLLPFNVKINASFRTAVEISINCFGNLNTCVLIKVKVYCSLQLQLVIASSCNDTGTLSIVSIINDDPTGGYRQGTFVSLHSTVRRDTVTSLPAGSVTRGIDVGGRSKKCRVTWFTCTGASVRGRGNTDLKLVMVWWVMRRWNNFHGKYRKYSISLWETVRNINEIWIEATGSVD